MPVFFGGQLLITPTVAVVVDDSAMRNQNLTVGNRVAIVGRSEGGAPKTPLVLRSPSHARQVLRSGELLKAVEKAFAPSPATNGPSQVVAVRVNPAVQASVTLDDASSADAITLTSTDYGLWTNQIKLKVESGTNAGKKVTTQVGESFYFKDDIARAAFSVVYTGAQATATITVSNSTVTLYAPSGTSVLAIDLATYPTVQQVVDKINSLAGSGWSATVSAGSANTPALNGLDAVTAQSVKTTAYTVRADLQALVDWFNSVGEGFITATRPSAANKVPANVNWTYLSGGSDGSVANEDWSDALDALETEDVQWVVPLSGTGAIHAMARDHCEFMSNAGKRERRAFVGGDAGLTDAQAAAAAAALAHDRVAYCHPGFYDYDDAGSLQLYAPYMLAAQVAGAFSGMNPGTPLTNKPLSVRGMERDIRAPTDTDYLITSGVLTVARSHRGDYRVVQSISTWLTDSKYNRVEVSTGAATDFVRRNVREAVEAFVGSKGSPITLTAIRSRVDTVLRELAREEPAGPGVIVGDRVNPAFRNIEVTLEGDVVRIAFECSPVIPINYILVTVHAVPYSGRLV